MRKLVVVVAILFCFMPFNFGMDNSNLDDDDDDESTSLEAKQERPDDIGLLGIAFKGLAFARHACQVSMQMVGDLVGYANEAVDLHAPMEWSEEYATTCLDKGQCSFLKQYLDRLLMLTSSPGALLQANAALIWTKKKANEGHTLCLYEVIRLFSKNVRNSTAAIDQGIVQDYLNLLVLFFYRIAIDCIKIKSGVFNGGMAIHDKELGYAEKIKVLFGERITIFAADDLYPVAKKFATDWLNENAKRDTFPSFIETYSMQLRKRISSGTYCQEITQENVRAFLINDKALFSNQEAIIEFIKKLFDGISSLEELLSSGGAMVKPELIDQIFQEEE